MRRSLLCVGVLFGLTVLMGADAKAATLLQDEIRIILENELGLELSPGAPGGDESFKVTEEAVAKMEALKEAKTPIKITNTNERSSQKRDAFKAMGFVPRKSDPKKQGADFELDVTDATIKALKGKTIVVDGMGKVKLK